jgi:RNA methyltransferase, TrmH family
MIKTITSANNQLIKNTVRLRQSRYARKAGLFIVEGSKEIDKAINKKFIPKSIFFCNKYLSQQAHNILSRVNDKSILLEVGENVFSKLALREKTDGLVVVFTRKTLSFDKINTKCKKILILDKIEKSGNIGAILRTAVAANVLTVVIIGTSDPFSCNTIRASIGAVFEVDIYHANIDECATFCKNNNIQIIASKLKEPTVSYRKVNYSKPTALIMGSEDLGISPVWDSCVDCFVKIPMSSKVDSLNVSVAAGIILYEWQNK